MEIKKTEKFTTMKRFEDTLKAVVSESRVARSKLLNNNSKSGDGEVLTLAQVTEELTKMELRLDEEFS